MNGFTPEDIGSNGPRAGKPWNPCGDADAGPHSLSYLHEVSRTISLISFNECPWQVKGLSLSMPSFTGDP
jgi:hypothetical protein